MTDNIDRAAEVIEDWVARKWGHPEDNAYAAASDLADAGLLTPDLPEPITNADVRLAALCREIDEIKKFVENFPLVPPLVGAGSTEARAYEMQEKVCHALAHILEGEA